MTGPTSARRLGSVLVALALTLTGLALIVPTAHAGVVVAQKTQHDWHRHNRNKTIDTTVKVYDDGTVEGVSTVESGVWLTGVRLCADAVLHDSTGTVLAKIDGDCWGVNGTYSSFHRRTDTWGGKVTADIAARTYDVQIIHWNDGVNWAQVLNFFVKVWEIYKIIAGAVDDAAAASDVVLPDGSRYTYSTYVRPGGMGGDCGGRDCIVPKE